MSAGADRPRSASHDADRGVARARLVLRMVACGRGRSLLFADVADEHGWNEQQRTNAARFIVLHEVGHLFGLTHKDGVPGMSAAEHTVMVLPKNDEEATFPDRRLTFSEKSIHKIRTELPPEGP